MAQRDHIELDAMPFDDLLIKRRSLRRNLSSRPNLQPVRIAVLGGSTTQQLVDLLELWLLDSGMSPTFYQSGYGRYFEDAVHDSGDLVSFRPEIVYVHTSIKNIQQHLPSPGVSHESAVEAEFGRFQQIWQALEEIGAIVIQNNFELPPWSILGNLDATEAGGQVRFIHSLNERFALAAADRSRLLLHDVCTLSARIGLSHWFDPERWFHAKIVTTPAATNAMARSLAGIVRAIYGRSRKVLVLDLDNTLWGGTVGDDGPERIVIGRETPLAEAYSAFQQYCLGLRNRGILLAVCSKNDEAIAKQGFSHRDSILKLEHISCFKANWNPKHDNIAEIAHELNLSPDSFVFVDDNPAEREIVRAQMPGIAVPEMGPDVARYPEILSRGHYFELVSLSAEDLARAASYQQNVQRAACEQRFSNYGEYLQSLDMTAEIEPFSSASIDRIAQLTNKTNQFNLTTQRYTVAEIEATVHDPCALGLAGRLSDRFGDHGLISVVLARQQGTIFEIDLWLMSCRVLKRNMEFAMLDALAAHARQRGATELRGRYLPTAKNGIVRDHYLQMGFALISEEADGSAQYAMPLAGYNPRNRHIRVSSSAWHTARAHSECNEAARKG